MKQRKERGNRLTVGFEPRLLGIARTWAYKHKLVDKDGNFVFSDALHGGVYEMEDELKELKEELKKLQEENTTLHAENEILKSRTGTGEKINCGFQDAARMVQVSEGFCIDCQLKGEKKMCPKIIRKPQVTMGVKNYRDDTGWKA